MLTKKQLFSYKELEQSEQGNYYHPYYIHIYSRIWARSVCMNENLEKGTVLPFLKVAQRNAMPVIVMNPNFNRDPVTKVNSS